MTLQLQVMSKWFLDNRLSLHAGKTETILFASKMKLRKDDTLSIKINDMVIEVKKVVNYLGCLIDNKLTGDFMARKVFSKVCGKIRFLARQAKFLDAHSLRLLAGALIQPHFDYATSFWYSSCSQVMKNKLQKAKNKLVRVILKVYSRSSLHSESFKELGLLTGKTDAFLKLVMSHKMVVWWWLLDGKLYLFRLGKLVVFYCKLCIVFCFLLFLKMSWICKWLEDTICFVSSAHSHNLYINIEGRNGNKPMALLCFYPWQFFKVYGILCILYSCL